MAKYAIRRVLLSVPVIFTVLLITWTLGFFGPGDPLTIQFQENPLDTIDYAQAERLRKLYGLDKPYLVQFGDYVFKLVKGDWGRSLRTRRPIFDSMKAAIPISFQLGAAASVVLIVTGIPLGVLAAAKQNTWVDYWITSLAISVRSVPVFVLAPLLMIITVLWLDLWRTPIGWEGLFNQKAILPVFLMSTGPLLGIVRMARSEVLEVFGQNYVRTARAKGLNERMVTTRHMLKNSMTPVLTTLGLTVSGLITGAFFVELIFNIPGAAGLGIKAFQARDYPMILGMTVIGATIIIVANLLVDVSYGFLDPRVRVE